MPLNQSLTTTVGGRWEPGEVCEESSKALQGALGEAGGQVSGAAAVKTEKDGAEHDGGPRPGSWE